MFTGIISDIGEVREVKKIVDDIEIIISTKFEKDDLYLGQSISCNGICLTITKIIEGNLSFYLSAETLSKTNAKFWNIGEKINLEMAMSANNRFDGHIVSGHIDYLAEVLEIRKESESYVFVVDMREKELFIDKGSVTLNGVSLTINKIDDKNSCFYINLIPHSLQNTNFQFLKIGSYLNLEIDMMAKYIKRQQNV